MQFFFFFFLDEKDTELVYRRAIFRLALRVDNINESLAASHQDRLPKQDRASDYLPEFHLCDEARSASEAARILPYAAYAWPLRGEGNFGYVDLSRPIVDALQKRCMIKVYNNVSSEAHDNLKHLVMSHPIGYAMAGLLMLMCLSRSENHPVHYQQLMPSIRTICMYAGSGTSILCEMEYLTSAMHGADLPRRRLHCPAGAVGTPPGQPGGRRSHLAGAARQPSDHVGRPAGSAAGGFLRAPRILVLDHVLAAALSTGSRSGSGVILPSPTRL